MGFYVQKIVTKKIEWEATTVAGLQQFLWIKNKVI